MTLLGQGAMGAVHIAQDVYLRRKVALKTILPEMATHPSILGRFVSEMQITAQLEHPNIVPVYALELGADGSLSYAMKLVHGRDLATLLRGAKEMTEKGQPLDEDHALDKRLD
jgi:serine/threonine-protein kinase